MHNRLVTCHAPLCFLRYEPTFYRQGRCPKEFGWQADGDLTNSCVFRTRNLVRNE